MCWQLLRMGRARSGSPCRWWCWSRSCSASASSASILRPLHNAPVLVRRGGVHRPARHLPLAGRRHLGPHHQGLPLAVPQSHLRRLGLHRPASDRHDRGDGRCCCWRCSPSSASRRWGSPCARPRRTRPRRGSPAFASTGCWRWAGGLAAAIGAVAGSAGRARRLPRAQHDGEHPALRLRRRAGRRHLEPRRRGGRRLHRRRAGEPDRLLRQPAREDHRASTSSATARS